MNSLLPILLEEHEDLKIYEHRGLIVMSAEDLGRCLGFADPVNSMDKLYQRNKEELADYRFAYKIDAESEEGFSVQTVRKTSGGRPSIYYSELGIYTVAMLAKTEVAKQFRRRIASMLQIIRLQQRLESAERYNALVEKYRRKPPLTQAEKDKIRALSAQGVGNNEIATMVGRSKGSISNFLKYGTASGRLKGSA